MARKSVVPKAACRPRPPEYPKVGTLKQFATVTRGSRRLYGIGQFLVQSVIFISPAFLNKKLWSRLTHRLPKFLGAGG
jgi:hypothetical protein